MEPRLSAACIRQKRWTGIFLCALAVAAHTNPLHLNSSCVHHYDKEKNCCNECQAGFYLSAPCTADRPVDCKPCGEGEYLEHSNSQTECLKQIECDEMKWFEVLRKGDAVTATQCICRADYHCSQDCEYCLRDSPCVQGFEVKEKADKKSDTKCTPCPPLSFSNETSFTVKCKQMTNCTALGLMEKVPGNATSDAVCVNIGASTLPSSDDSTLAITVGLACGCGIIIVFICAIIFHRKTLTTLTDCIQQRFADAWCTIRGKKRSEGTPPVDPAIGKLPSDNRNWDPESELLYPWKKLVGATEQANGSIFYAFTEGPHCSCASVPSCEVESTCRAAHSPRIPRENPEREYYIGDEGRGPSTTLSQDPSAGTSTNPLLSSGYEAEESIPSNISAQASRNNADTAPFRHSQVRAPCSAPASGSASPLSARQSGSDRPPKCDCHRGHQSNSTSSNQKPENIPGHSSTNPGSDHPNPADDSSHKSGHSTPSGFSSGGNTTYNTSGQSVLSVGSSVIFNVIVNVNNAAEQDKRGDVNDRPNLPTKEKDKRDSSRGCDRFPTEEGEEEKPGSECGSETGTGPPVQEELSTEPPCVPVQEEQSSIDSRERGLPQQERQNSGESWGGNLSFARKTAEQESREHPKGSTFFPVQEDGKSEHLAKEEVNL